MIVMIHPSRHDLRHGQLHQRPQRIRYVDCLRGCRCRVGGELMAQSFMLKRVGQDGPNAAARSLDAASSFEKERVRGIWFGGDHVATSEYPPCPPLEKGGIFFAAISLMAALFIALNPSMSVAQTAATAPSPEQQRQSLIQALQKRFPGTTPNDWVLGVENPAAGVQAIPLNADNATNSADILAIGKKAWDRKFRNGKSLATCFPNGGKRVAATYPQFDAKARQVVTVEMAINQCLVLHGEAEIAATDTTAMGPLSAYFKSLSDGQPLNVRVSTVQAREKFDSGRALFQRRIGREDQACASCHVLNAGSVVGQHGMSAVVGQAVTWPRLQPGGQVLRLQVQFQRCMQRSGAEPFALGSEEFNNLEYFHAFVSNGLATRTLAVQR